MIPRVLRNFGLFVNGSGYAGRVTEAELPEISIKAEEHRGGGMDGVAEIDLGMEAMSAKLTFAEYVSDIFKSVGKMDGNAVRVQLRGALQRDGETAIPCIVELHGSFKKSTMGTWKAGDLATHEIEMAVRYYRLTIGSERLIEIDVENMIRWIGDKDELASIREAIGL
jgi:P2 family phage contractile tail tube protein